MQLWRTRMTPSADVNRQDCSAPALKGWAQPKDKYGKEKQRKDRDRERENADVVHSVYPPVGRNRRRSARLLVGRDDLITLLARGDTAAAERLANASVSVRKLFDQRTGAP
jgi:hypothetical protein